MKNRFNQILFMTLLILMLSVQLCSADPNTYSYWDFHEMISQFKEYWIIPNTNGTFHTSPEYSRAYANINHSVWNGIDDSIYNFALSMDVSWASASYTPNTFYAGCGLLFRFNGINDEYLFASARMDGNVYVTGKRFGKSLNFGKFYYGRSSIQATKNLTVVANGNNLKIFIDGKLLANIREVPVDRDGALALTTLSGTNQDWGTRCVFSNINYYTW